MEARDIIYVVIVLTVATLCGYFAFKYTGKVDLMVTTVAIVGAVGTFITGAIDRKITPPKSMIGAIFITLAVTVGLSMVYTVQNMVIAVENMQKIQIYIEVTKLIIQTVVTSILGVLGANLLKGSKVEVAVTSDYPVKRIEVEPLEKK